MAALIAGTGAGGLVLGLAMSFWAAIASPLRYAVPGSLRLGMLLVIAAGVACFAYRRTSYSCALGARRQIPIEVLARGPSGFFQFGLELGVAFRTHLTAPGLYALFGAAALWDLASVALVAACIGFGLGRSLGPVTSYLRAEGTSRALARAQSGTQ